MSLPKLTAAALAALTMGMPLAAEAQTAPPPGVAAAAAPAKAGAYTTADTEISVILADPKAKAVMAKHLPRITADERIGQAGGLTLAQLQQFSPDVTPEVLAAIDADFAKLAAGK